MWVRVRSFIARRAWLAFALMGLFFFLFGVTSLNLLVLFRANIELFLEHGVMVLSDGAGQQLLELLFYGYLSMAFYAGFKFCEVLLVNRLSGKNEENS